jgi:hypothetical protein
MRTCIKKKVRDCRKKRVLHEGLGNFDYDECIAFSFIDCPHHIHSEPRGGL